MAAQASCEERLDSVSRRWQIPLSSFQTGRKGRCGKPVEFYFKSSFFNNFNTPAGFLLIPVGIPNRWSCSPLRTYTSKWTQAQAWGPPGSEHKQGCHELLSTPSAPLCLHNALGNDLTQGWSLAPWRPAVPGQQAGQRASQQQQARPQVQKGNPGPACWGRTGNSVHNCPAGQLHVKRTLWENVCLLEIMLNFISVFQNLCGKFIKFFLRKI